MGETESTPKPFSKVHQDALEAMLKKRAKKKQMNIFPRRSLRIKAKLVNQISEIVDKIVTKMKERSEAKAEYAKAKVDALTSVLGILELSPGIIGKMEFKGRVNGSEIAHQCIHRGTKYLNGLKQQLERLLEQ